jgi:hypothetical protein
MIGLPLGLPRWLLPQYFFYPRDHGWRLIDHLFGQFL